MGARGPIPKRSDERRRTNDTGTVTKAKASKHVRRPAVNSKWHSIAKRWYLSLAGSGQSVFYEPSDWAQAYFIAEAMSRLLESKSTRGMSAQLFAAIDSATARLMTTEGDRRRLRIELERDAGGIDPDEEAAVTSIAEWRGRVEGG